MKSTSAATSMFMAGDPAAQAPVDAAAIDRAVVSKLSAEFGINSKVVTVLDLTKPFQNKSKWNLVAAKQPDEGSSAWMESATEKGPFPYVS